MSDTRRLIIFVIGVIAVTAAAIYLADPPYAGGSEFDERFLRVESSRVVCRETLT